MIIELKVKFLSLSLLLAILHWRPCCLSEAQYMEWARKFKSYPRFHSLPRTSWISLTLIKLRGQYTFLCRCITRMETAVFSFIHPTRFIAMVAKPESRAAFIRSAISFLRTHNFDGLNLDWQYPGHNGSPEQDKEKFTLLIMVSTDLIFQQQLLQISGVYQCFLCHSIGVVPKISQCWTFMWL